MLSEDRLADAAEAVPAEMGARSALLLLGSTHLTAAGRTARPTGYRTGLTAGLDSASVRQEEKTYFALSPEVVKS